MPRAKEGGAVQDVFLELFEVKIDDRRDVERDELGNYQAADNDQAERPARRTIGSKPERDRDRAEDRGQRRH